MLRSILSAMIATCIMAYTVVPVVAATPVERSLPAAANLNNEQMDNLLAAIALYPDPLLAQMLPASTFVDQIDAAARYLRANNNQPTNVEKQKWDVSVMSVAHYPQVIYMMSDKLDWTTALGQAYVNQSTDVFSSIQRLRARAKAAGYLVTTPQQTVIVEKEVIKVVPAQPQYIYVPTYNPQVVYVQTGPSTGTVVATAAIAFGAGLLIGAWLNNDCDWYYHRVYYHGWHGSGWIGYSSVHIHTSNNFYVHSRYTNVNINRTVVNRNVNYNNISHYNSVHRNVNYNNFNRNNTNINHNNPGGNNRPATYPNNAGRNIRNSNVNDYRGRTNAASPANQPANRGATRNSGFGGFGNRSQTTQQKRRALENRSMSLQGISLSSPLNTIN